MSQSLCCRSAFYWELSVAATIGTMATDQQVDVAIERSGIAKILSLPNREDAEQLHDYLKAQGCTVGEIFEARHEFSFFAYSLKHSIRETIARHGGFRLVERPSEIE
jgi:hypothetical protein